MIGNPLAYLGSKPRFAALLAALLLSPILHAQELGNDKWYFSWGYSRQQYAPSDIHVSQPSLGNDFTVRQAAASDFPATFQETLDSIGSLDITTPQENLRFGRYMNAEKTFALEFSVDHTKYNTNLYQTATVNGTIANQPYNGPMVLNPQNFYYALHNGLNHIMVNGVWLQHLYGPEKQVGALQLISRVGAGILLPHADNTILGNANQVGPKTKMSAALPAMTGGRSTAGPLASRSGCATASTNRCTWSSPPRWPMGLCAVCRCTKARPIKISGCPSKSCLPAFTFKP